MAYKTLKQKKVYNKNYYLNNSVQIIGNVMIRNKIRLELNRKRIINYLSDHPCVDCGNTDIRVLEFDHVRGIKKYNVCAMIRLKISWTSIKCEIEKCDIRCANCHRIKTIQTLGYYKAIKS
jgi:hypothetical protein